MENSLNKAELAAQLGAKGIQFPREASVADLRALYAKHIGKASSEKAKETDNGNEPEKPTESQQGENTTNDSDANDDLNKDSGTNAEKDKTNEKNKTNNEDPKHTENEDAEKEQAELDEILLRIPKTKTAIELHNIQIEEELIEARLRLLEKKKRLFELESSMFTPMTQQHLKPSYKDIKHLVPLFSSSDEYDARKWIADFERACDTLNADNVTRLKFFRQSMKSETDAESFLRTDHSASYSEIRQNFLANFGHVYSVSEVIDKLRKTTFSSVKSSVMGYILKMQEIAARADIDELQTVQFIIDGFQDKSAHIAILYPAHTIARLKELALFAIARNKPASVFRSTKTKTNGRFRYIGYNQQFRIDYPML